jgi:hypothetical protein
MFCPALIEIIPNKGRVTGGGVLFGKGGHEDK